MVKQDIPEISKAWQCEIKTDIDTFTRLFASYMRTQELPLSRPLQKMLIDLPMWAGVVFYQLGHKMEVVAVLHITQISPDSLEVWLEQCKLGNSDVEAKITNHLQPVFSFIRELYKAKMPERHIVAPRRMRLAPLKMELAFKSNVNAHEINKWFEEFCYKYEGNAWTIHYSAVRGFTYNTVDRIYANTITASDPGSLQCLFLECVEIWSLYTTPLSDGKVLVEVYAWKQGEIFKQIQEDLQQFFQISKLSETDNEKPNDQNQTNQKEKRGMKLGTAERVREFHRLVKSGLSHRQAKKQSRCDPSTYYQWCQEATGEEPKESYR